VTQISSCCHEALPLNPSDTLTLLTQIGSYDTAFTFAEIFGLDCEVIFEDLTGKCVENTGNEDSLLRGEDIRPVVVWSDTMLSAYDGKQSERLWKLLQRYLAKFDLETAGYRHHRLVIEKILSAERDVQLPSWLLLPYRLQTSQSQPKASPSDLLKAYIRYDVIPEAVDYALSLIVARTESLKRPSPSIMPASRKNFWLPYSLFDQLDFILKEKRDSARQEALKTKLDELFQVIQGQTDRMLGQDKSDGS